MLDEIAGYVPTHIRESRKNSKLVDKDGFITIFRGNGLKSTKAMSWTTDLKTAKFFAYRYDDDGYVVNGKVHVDDVIFIFDEDYGEDCKDSEKEILVVAGSVKNRKRIKTSKEK